MLVTLLIHLSIFELFFIHFIRSDENCNKFKGILLIKHFDSFDDLNFSSCYLNESIVRFIPNNRLILDSHLSINLTDKKYSNLNEINFYHLKGIDLNTKVFQISKFKYFPYFKIIKFDFNFYHKNKIITENDCGSLDIYNSFDTLFKYLPSYLQFSDCIYTNIVCSFVFKNSHINYLYFSYVSSSTLKNNKLKFSATKVLNTSLRSIIENVHFNDFFHIDFNSNLLNEQVFKYVKNIVFEGSFSNMQKDIFSNFHYIKSIQLLLYNLKDSMHQGLNWMEFLKNNHSKITISLLNYKILFNNFYSFPEEDFCLFSNSLKDENFKIFTDLENYQNKDNLSCVLLGFLSNLNQQDLLALQWYSHCCINDSNYFKDLFQRCQNINCSIKNQSWNNQSEIISFDYYDFVKIVSNLQIYFEYILQPVVSTFGIFLNMFVIYILKKKDNKKDFEEKMYSYICYNSIFNILIFLIDFIGYINKCTLDVTFFCPDIRESIVSQYIFIFLNFYGSFFEFCSNFTMFFVSVERFRKLHVFNSKLFIFLLNYFDKHFLKLLISIAFIFNFSKLFEFNINDNFVLLINETNFPYQIMGIDFTNEIISYIFYVSLLINDLISKFLILIFNLFIDVQIFIKYKMAIQNKLKLGILTSKNKILSYNSLIRFIIINSVLSLLLRSPQLILFIITKYYKFKYTSKLLAQFQVDFNDLDFNIVSKQYFDKIYKTSQFLSKTSLLLLFFILFFTNITFKKKIKLFLKKKKK